MPDAPHAFAVADPATDREYSAEPGHRHRHRHHDHDPAAATHARHHGKLRRAFFALTAFWGFTVGATASVVAFAAVEGSSRWGTASMLALGAGAVAAVLGGLVASQAYKDLKSRR